MEPRLAIVTGFGPLYEDVVKLADAIRVEHAWFTVKPWMPFPPLFFPKTRGVVAVNPFHFLEIETELRAREVKRIFFTGQFPADRFLQAVISEWLKRLSDIADKRQMRYISGTLEGLSNFADEKCIRYFSETPTSLPRVKRYFLALEKLLRDLRIRPVLANAVFPELNVDAGYVSVQHPSKEIVDALPDWLVTVANSLPLKQRGRARFSHAVIIDNGIIAHDKGDGTKDLLRSYAKRKCAKNRPFLFKPPSVEFNPALDQPTIGRDTIEQCKAAGVKGIVVCAEATIVASLSETIKAINETEMFLYAMPLKQVAEVYRQHLPDTWARNASITAELLRNPFRPLPSEQTQTL